VAGADGRSASSRAEGAQVDLLVVGLGVTGAGVALDAASRGLSVVAVDMADLAFGTSRWSSKLIHGGLRYLAGGDVAVAYECARERGILLTRTAPHLVRPLPVVLPLAATVSRNAGTLYRVGTAAGDVLRMVAGTPGSLLPRARRISTTRTLEYAPGLKLDGLRGGNLHWDGQAEDDARLVTAIARTAAGHGARVLTRCRVLSLDIADGRSASSRAVMAALVRDELSGEELEIRARCVVNATGVWADQLVPGVKLRPSRGTHIVVRSQRLGGLGCELTIPVPGESRRFVFAVPHPNGLAHVGITDEPVDGAVPDVPEPPESDIAFLLDVLNDALREPLHRTDVVGAFAGLRPLLDDGTERSADVSRRHHIAVSPGGVVTIVGGKLTAYRQMAQDAVDTAVRRNGIDARPCRTRTVELVGAAPRSSLARIDAPSTLVRRYGVEAPLVAELAAAEGLTAKVAEDVIEAELVWALRHEGALTVDDLLDRRTRIGLVPADRAAALPRAEALFAAYR
jgi:glycerol-3-phosphate dehydrogenase